MKKLLIPVMLLAAAATALAFDVKTDDKQPFPTFKVTGWVKATYQDTVYHEKGRVTPSTFDIKDAALVVGGDAWGNTSYRIYLQGNRRNKADSIDKFLKQNYGVYSARLVEAYVDWKPSPLYSFRVGQYKKPMGMENLTAATSYDFITSTQLTAKFLDNNYDQGAMGYGKWNDLSYWLSLHNGASYDYKDKNWAKDVIARAAYLPLAGLTVGGSAEYGTSDGAGASLYRRRGGLEANYEWNKFYARAEFMIGSDDKSVSDSLRGSRARTLDTLISAVYDTTLHTWGTRVTTKADTVYKWTTPARIDQKLMRSAYLTVGYVVMPKLRVAGRVDLYRESSWLPYQKSGVNKISPRSEIRTIIWTLGADYFLNPNAKVTINYDMREEDLAQMPYMNNVLSLQAQVKF